MGMLFSIPIACQPLYARLEDTSASGGVYQPDITTEAQCLSGCATTDRCRGVDLAPTTEYLCWFHIDIIGPARTIPGVIHFVLIDRCPGGILTHIVVSLTGPVTNADIYITIYTNIGHL